MITKLKLYESKSSIKDNKKIIYFIDDLKQVIREINEDFYKEIFYIKVDYNNIHNLYTLEIKDCISYRFYFKYLILIDNFDRIVIKNEIIRETYYITNYQELLEKIKDKLFKKYIYHIFDININNIDDLIKYTERVQNLHNSIVLDSFLEILLKYGFPKIIQDKYQHLINSKNFDLI